MAPISLRQVEAFKAVMEHGIVSRAATVLGISQPALSKLIAGLEHDSGLALFDRRKGRLVPTAPGLRFYAEVDRIFVGLGQLQRAIDDIRLDHTERLRIGVIPALAGGLLQRTVQLYQASHPDVHLSIYVRESQFLSDWIENGKLDLLVASWATDIHGLVETPLMQAPVVCVMPAGHELARHEAITPALLAGQRFLSLTEDSFLPARLAAVCRQQGVEPEIAAEISAATALCRMVEAGLGISLLHPLVVADSGADVLTRPFHPPVPVNFHIYRTPAQAERTASEDFVASLRQAVDDLLVGAPSSHAE